MKREQIDIMLLLRTIAWLVVILVFVVYAINELEDKSSFETYWKDREADTVREIIFEGDTIFVNSFGEVVKFK